MPHASRLASLVLGCVVVASSAHAQTPPTAGTASTDPPAATVSVAPPEYLIGAEDVLAISIWREPELSGEFTVRPDGRISMLLVNDVQAAGLTTEALRQHLTKAFASFVDAPSVGVSVRTMNSRKVYITGNVGKPGMYPLGAHLTVVQLIALAGGLQEFADKQNVVVIRGTPGPGEPAGLTVNYEEISRGRSLHQNVELKPGDTVIVR